MKSVDIHYRKRKVDRLLKRIRSAKKLSDENKIELINFYNQCSANGLSSGRLQKLLNVLVKLAGWLKKDFKKADRNDIVKLVQVIERQDYAEWTKYDYKVILRKFYKWLRKTEDHYPDEVRWIKPRIKNSQHKLPEELLTEEEIKRLVGAADHIRDKALIFTLYESGCRIGEIADLKIKNVRFDKYGAALVVTGKTGDRRVRLIGAAPLLANWVDNHPYRENPDAPLWVGIGARSKNKMITYNTMAMMIKKVAQRAGVKKNVHPHLFRHSRATYLAKHLTEAQLKQIFGWTQSSDMASVYVHLSGRDTDDAILKLTGIKKDSEPEESKLKPISCPRCSMINSATARFCQRCSLALEVKTAMVIDEIRGLGDELILGLVNDSKGQKILRERMIKLGLGKKLLEIFASRIKQV